MANFKRKIARGIIQDTLKKNDIPKKIRQRKTKELYKVVNNSSALDEKKSLNTLSLANVIIEMLQDIKLTGKDEIFNKEFSKILDILKSEKLYVQGLYLRVVKDHAQTLNLAKDRILFYINEISKENLNISLVSLLLLIVENNMVYGKNIFNNKKELEDIICPLIKYIENNNNSGYIYTQGLQKKVNNIENDYSKGFALKTMMRNMNDLILDLIAHLNLSDKEDHIIDVSSELLTRAIEISNTYSIIDSNYRDNKDSLALIIRLSYFYVIFKEYEEKNNYLKNRIIKDFKSFFNNSEQYKNDEISINTVDALNTIVNYDYNNTEFFLKYNVEKEEIVKPIFKIFYVALSDLLTITRIIDTYSEEILIKNPSELQSRYGLTADDVIVKKDVYLQELYKMLNDYRVFLCCEIDSLTCLSKLYYLTYVAERVALTSFIAEMNIKSLEKFIKKYGFFKQYKHYIEF